MADDEEESLQHIRREEESRGSRRRVPDADVLKERRLRRELMRILLEINDTGLLVKVLTGEFELKVGSEAYKRALQVWNEIRRK
jgi:hypothetical protein